MALNRSESPFVLHADSPGGSESSPGDADKLRAAREKNRARVEREDAENRESAQKKAVNSNTIFRSVQPREPASAPSMHERVMMPRGKGSPSTSTPPKSVPTTSQPTMQEREAFGKLSMVERFVLISYAFGLETKEIDGIVEKCEPDGSRGAAEVFDAVCRMLEIGGPEEERISSATKLYFDLNSVRLVEVKSLERNSDEGR